MAISMWWAIGAFVFALALCRVMLASKAVVSSQNKCEYGLLRANSARTGAHYLRMNDGD
jgi:hypothetical protein